METLTWEQQVVHDARVRSLSRFKDEWENWSCPAEVGQDGPPAVLPQRRPGRPPEEMGRNVLGLISAARALPFSACLRLQAGDRLPVQPSWGFVAEREAVNPPSVDRQPATTAAATTGPGLFRRSCSRLLRWRRVSTERSAKQ